MAGDGHKQVTIPFHFYASLASPTAGPDSQRHNNGAPAAAYLIGVRRKTSQE
jgi:hypothetical protein